MEASAQLPATPPSPLQPLNQLKNRRKVRELHRADGGTATVAGRELTLEARTQPAPQPLSPQPLLLRQVCLLPLYRY